MRERFLKLGDISLSLCKRGKVVKRNGRDVNYDYELEIGNALARSLASRRRGLRPGGPNRWKFYSPSLVSLIADIINTDDVASRV